MQQSGQVNAVFRFNQRRVNTFNAHRARHSLTLAMMVFKFKLATKLAVAMNASEDRLSVQLWLSLLIFHGV